MIILSGNKGIFRGISEQNIKHNRQREWEIAKILSNYTYMLWFKWAAFWQCATWMLSADGKWHSLWWCFKKLVLLTRTMNLWALITNIFHYLSVVQKLDLQVPEKMYRDGLRQPLSYWNMKKFRGHTSIPALHNANLANVYKWIFSIQFDTSLMVQGKWASVCVVLSCWLGLKHDRNVQLAINQRGSY